MKAEADLEREAIQAESQRRRNGNGIELVPMAGVKTEKVDWLWPQRIPIGKVTLIEGDPGIGKSTVTLAVATALSLGKGLPGMPNVPRGVTLLMSAEDGLADTVKPRLEMLGADTSMIFAIEKPVTFDYQGCSNLDAKIAECVARLVIIDPLFAYFSIKTDIHKANETRAVMSRLAAIAACRRCAILAVRHLTKGGRDKSIYRGQGSIDLTAACRSVLLVGADPSDRRRRAVVQIKNNLTAMAPPIGYEIVEGQFAWTGASDLTAERILASEQSSSDGLPIDDAMEFLRELLADGPVVQKKVVSEAREQGISERTLYRAKTELKVKSRKQRAGGWAWELPQDCQSKIATHGKAGHVGGQLDL